ncbi:MAG: hypothetical protein QNJ55_00230 [Xenococcus sp. MO_188.B8]|nr:hypothetical protein [Xenococcus sp. MO_188.B8]
MASGRSHYVDPQERQLQALGGGDQILNTADQVRLQIETLKRAAECSIISVIADILGWVEA